MIFVLICIQAFLIIAFVGANEIEEGKFTEATTKEDPTMCFHPFAKFRIHIISTSRP